MMNLNDIRKAFDKTMVQRVEEILPRENWELIPINAASKPDLSKLHIISALRPGEVFPEELGGPQATSRRVGVYIITLSLPKGRGIDDYLNISAALESRYRRINLPAAGCHIRCQEPYTENRGLDPDEGRYLISTTVPWYVLFNGTRE